MRSRQRDGLHMVIGRPDDQIDLAEAALLIAKEEYPELDVPSYLGRLDGLADEAAPRVTAAGPNPFAIVDALNGFLFREKGFKGNSDDYFDPRNSYLNEVIDRRRGIPITLSVVYMEVASRLGLSLEGVGFPGHFIVRFTADDREVLLDPFHRGAVLLRDDCRKRLKATYGREIPLESRFFRRVGPKQILARILNNLKHIYTEKRDFRRVLRVLEGLMILVPGNAHHVRDRGVAHLKMVHLSQAAADLEAYIRLSPEAPDATSVRKQLKRIRRLEAMLN